MEKSAIASYATVELDNIYRGRSNDKEYINSFINFLQDFIKSIEENNTIAYSGVSDIFWPFYSFMVNEKYIEEIPGLTVDLVSQTITYFILSLIGRLQHFSSKSTEGELHKLIRVCSKISRALSVKEVAPWRPQFLVVA